MGGGALGRVVRAACDAQHAPRALRRLLRERPGRTDRAVAAAWRGGRAARAWPRRGLAPSARPGGTHAGRPAGARLSHRAHRIGVGRDAAAGLSGGLRPVAQLGCGCARSGGVRQGADTDAGPVSRAGLAGACAAGGQDQVRL
ncbi:hypothetical protein TW83_13475 [Paracoccus sp. S4493]|nr:hypothetical protein TW83_13475 [Paracoccus sp. S4493]